MKEILTIFITLKVATVKNQKISTNISVAIVCTLLNQISFFIWPYDLQIWRQKFFYINETADLSP